MARQPVEEEEEEVGHTVEIAQAVSELGFPTEALTSGLTPSEMSQIARSTDLLRGMGGLLNDPTVWVRIRELAALAGGAQGAAETIIMNEYVKTRGLPVEAVSSGLTLAQFTELEGKFEQTEGLEELLKDPDAWKRIHEAGGGQMGLDAVILQLIQQAQLA